MSLEVRVLPGICGFECTIRTSKVDRRSAKVEIISECKQIKKVSEEIKEVGLKEVFLPISKNPVYQAAERSGCHTSCAIPSAILKACEVTLDIALPKDVMFSFNRSLKGEM